MPGSKTGAAASRIQVGLSRLELLTSRLSGVRSSQLSYRPSPSSSACSGPALRLDLSLPQNKATWNGFIKWLGFARKLAELDWQ
jgi:hypothetical protein